MATAGLLGIVADDDFAVLYLVVTALRTAGYEALPARDGVEALRLLEQRSEQIRFLLTDIEMPVMNGLDLTRVVRARFPSIAVVLMSGRTIAQSESELAHALLTKPFTPATLIGSVGTAMAAVSGD